jgi:hypothetical protein
MFDFLKSFISQNTTSLIKTLVMVAVVIFFVLNLSSILKWFKSIFTNITVAELPTNAQLNDPKYVISSKIIKGYVDTIIEAVDRFGTDEVSLNNVYQNLKSSSTTNTLAVYNEFKNRALNYNHWIGDFEKLSFFGEKMDLYTVLKSELATGSQSEKNAWVNWDWLIRKRAHIL